MQDNPKTPDAEFTDLVNQNAADAMDTLAELERFRPLFRLRQFDTLLGTLRVQVLELAHAKADRDWIDQRLQAAADRTGRGQAPVIKGPEDLDTQGRLVQRQSSRPRDY